MVSLLLSASKLPSIRQKHYFFQNKNGFCYPFFQLRKNHLIKGLFLKGILGKNAKFEIVLFHYLIIKKRERLGALVGCLGHLQIDPTLLNSLLQR